MPVIGSARLRLWWKGTDPNCDYRVTAVADGVATLWPELQQACFAVWRRKFARLRDTTEGLAELEGLAGGP